MNRESSSLSPPTTYVKGCPVTREWLSGRASPCQGESRGFDPRLPLQVALALSEDTLHKRLCPREWASAHATTTIDHDAAARVLNVAKY
jgi:hypothetical protein